MPADEASYGAYRRIALVETYVDPHDTVIRTRDSFLVTPSFGAVYYREMDLGAPDIKEATQDLPQADGTYDETQYTGGRSVTVSGVVLDDGFENLPEDNGWDSSIGWNSSAYWCTVLSAWSRPSRRYQLYFRDNSGNDRFMNVRGAGFDAGVTMDTRQYREWQLQFYNPSGKILRYDLSNPFSAGQHRVIVTQSGVEAPGVPVPIEIPIDFPDALPSEQPIYEGTVANGFTANVHTGNVSMTNPRITVTGPDNVPQSIGLSGVTIPDTTVVCFDTVERTVRSRPDVFTSGWAWTNLAQYLTAPIQWPVLKPGINRLTSNYAAMQPGYNSVIFDFTTGAGYLELLWNDADLA